MDDRVLEMIATSLQYAIQIHIHYHYYYLPEYKWNRIS